MPLTGCRVRSGEACQQTQKRHCNEVSRIRSIASGGDPLIQLEAEVKSLTKEERDELLCQAQLPVFIHTEHALAMNIIPTFARISTIFNFP